MERKMTIGYNWLNEEGETPTKSHQEQLEDDAVSRIFEMLREGYTSGELVSYAYSDEIEIGYYGHWSVRLEEKDGQLSRKHYAKV
jgi:hypothetical protein